MSENLIVGIVALESKETTAISAIASDYIEQINACLFSNVTVAIGSVQTTISNAPISYTDSLDTLCNRLLCGDNCVLDYEIIYSQEICTNVITPQIKEQIQHALLYYDVRMFSDIIKRIFDIFKECSCTFCCVQNSCSSIISLVLSTYRTQVPKEFSKMLGTGVSAELAVHCSSIDELKELMISKLSEHIKTARKQSAPAIPDRIEKIKVYILENLSDPSLNIDSISKQFYISYHHLYSTFKKRFGCSPSKYYNHDE